MSNDNKKGSTQHFSSRRGFILSVPGIAIGTGNIWRFPRIVAQNRGDNGAGAFLIAWISFLLLWSIPLIIGEYALGMKRPVAIATVVLVSYLLGIPSARNLNLLSNQDFVRGLALMLSVALIAFILIRQGLSNLRKVDILGNKDDWRIGKWWERVMKYFIPVAASVLLIWWLSLSALVDQWYNPFKSYSLMTCLAQWAFVLFVLVLLNRRIYKKMKN